MPDFSARIASLAAYTKAHPETVLVDSLDKVHQVSCPLTFSSGLCCVVPSMQTHTFTLCKYSLLHNAQLSDSNFHPFHALFPVLCPALS